MYEGLAPLTDYGLWARSSGLEIVLFITGAVLLTRFVTWLSRHITGRIDTEANGDTAVAEDAKHRHAVIQVVAWAFLVLVYSITAVLVVERLDIPLSGIVAPATVLGVALGFGAQRIVQDLLAGFFVVTERQYGFGDLVRLNVPGTITPLTGTVEEVTLRMTRIRTANGEVVTTPNGQIIQVVNLSRDWARAVVDVPIPATADVTRVSALLVDVGNEMYREDERHNLLLDPPTVMGVESLDIDQLKIRVVARTLPGRQFDIGRALRARITSALRREGINVPADVNTVPATSAS